MDILRHASLAILASIALFASENRTGDFKGALQKPDGTSAGIVAQVRDMGNNSYQAVFRNSAYETDSHPLLTLDSHASDATHIQFNNGEALLTSESFTGALPIGNINLKPFSLTSPTMGLQPPADSNAIRLVAPGKTRLAAWRNPLKDGLERWTVHADEGIIQIAPKGGNMLTEQEFGSCFLHIEFKNADLPQARGQSRSNSGIYIQGRYELQILDSYAMEPQFDHCGGFYRQATPRLNMCLPPDTWQTYDIDFTAPTLDAEGHVLKYAHVTVRHNGVIIHNDVILKPTPGGISRKEAAKGPLMIQDHGAPVSFRNIWIIEK